MKAIWKDQSARHPKRRRAKRITFRRGEQGQAIVLIALLIIILLGFTALAVDGGGLLFLKRDAQNAADAAALAGAYAKCAGGTDIVTAGRTAATQNGFTHDGTNYWVTINNPPSSGTYSDPTNFVEAIVTANKPSFFAQLVYDGPLQVTGRAVVQCFPTAGGGDNGALWAGGACSTDCTIELNGSHIRVYGGVHSNDSICWSGSQNCVVGEVSRLSGAYLNPSSGSEVCYNTACTDAPPADQQSGVPSGCKISYNDPDANPTTELTTQADPLAYITAARFLNSGGANDIYAAALAQNRVYYTSSKMDSGWFSGANCPGSPFGGSACRSGNTLAPGLYISTHVDGIEIADQYRTSHADGTTFVGINGNVMFPGSNLNLKPYLGKTLMDDGLPELLAISFKDQGNNSDQCSKESIKINGSDTRFEGVLYAPLGMVWLDGSKNWSPRAALVGWGIMLNGSNHWIQYDPNLFPPDPPEVGPAPP